MADTTFGVGLGSLYNGLGFNLGQTSKNSMIYSSLGCLGDSASQSSSRSGNDYIGYGTNCGIGLGYVNLSLLPSSNRGLSLSVSYTYDTDSHSDSSSYHVMPGYHFFWNGLERSGLNLGLSARITFREKEFEPAGLMFNLGYQF